MDMAAAPHPDSRNRRDAGSKVEQNIAVIAYLVKPERIVGSSDGEGAYTRLQEIRQQYDDAYSRWVPHITLIPPFLVDADRLDSIAASMTRVCARHDAHEVDFGRVGQFKLRRYTNVHLGANGGSGKKGDDAGGLAALSELQADLDDTIGSSPSTQSRRGGSSNKQQPSDRAFTPHISLGQAYTQYQIDAISKAALKKVGSLTLHVNGITLMSKPQSRSGPYDVWSEVSLADPEEGAEAAAG